jgi:hypothetical protein
MPDKVMAAHPRLEAEYGSDEPLDTPVILLESIVEVLAPADADRLEPPRAVP